MPFHARGTIRHEDTTTHSLRFISYILAFAALIYAILYSGPEGWVRRARPDLHNQVSIVQHIEGLGPVWPILFFGVALLGFVSTYMGRGLIVSHGIGAGAWVMYSLSVLLGAVLSEPPNPIMTGLTTLLGAMVHLGMARAWAGEGVQ